MQKDTNFLKHLSHLMMDINEKINDDKENQQNFDIRKFSHQIKVQRNTLTNQIQKVKLRKTAQTFQVQNQQNPLQNFEFINTEILPVQGICFPKEEAKLINNALKHFKKTQNKNYEFFGKVYGTQKDYIVIFSNDPKTQNEEEEVKIETPQHWEKKGINKFEFRVLIDEFDNWKKLDMVSPQQMRQSRHVNIYMSGHLNLDLKSKGFDGTEENYLSCQLIRILSACYCVPGSYYKFEEEIKDIQVDNESMSTFFQTREEIANTENWVHRFPIILKSGRVKHFIPLHRNEEDKEQLKDELDENDPNCDRLRALNEDTENLWNFKFYGKKEFYIEKNEDDDEEKQKQIGNVVMTNKNWNGAMNIFSINHQTSMFLYLGYGFKNPLFNLSNKVHEFQIEPRQRKEQPEPNHHEEPEPEEGEENNENEEQDEDEQKEEQNDPQEGEEEEKVEDQEQQE